MHRCFLALAAVAAAISCESSERVDAADFGYSAEDATAALQSAIDSGARTVVVGADPGDWCIRPVKLRSNLELVFGENVRVRAVPGAFRNRYDMMFTGRNVTNVTVRGMSGAAIEMFKKDYLEAERYVWSEWRHMIAFYDSADIAVEGLSLSSSGGDGVYIARCRNVRIENLLCVGHDRQGISVIGAENLLVRRCRFCFTEGTPPQCGIDFEPNSSKEHFVSCVVEDCEFDGNCSYGALFHIPHMNGKSRPLSVKFKNCRFSGNRQCGARVFATWDAARTVRGAIKFEKCVFAGNRNGGVSLASMPPEGFRVDFRDCVIDCRGCPQRPIVFDNGAAKFDFGGVSFKNVTVLADSPDVIAFHGMTGVGVTNVCGEIKVVSSNVVSGLSLAEFASARPSDPSARNFRAASVSLRRLSPVFPQALPPPSDAVFCRGRQLFVQKVPSAGKRKFRFLTRHSNPGGGGHPVEVKVDITDKVGTPVDSFTITGDGKEYELESATANDYLFCVNSRGNECAVVSPLGGHGVRADSRVRLVAGGARDFFFCVPASSEEVSLEIVASRSCPLSAKIVDAAGEVRHVLENAREGHIVRIPRRKSAAGEVWRIAVAECGGAGYFDLRIGRFATAVVSGSRESCLAE